MKNRFKRSSLILSENERRKRKREIILIVLVPIVISVLTYVENRMIHFGSTFPVSNTILMFILININLLLLILLMFLVFRNIVKLLYDRKRKVAGARLRTRLVVAFIGLTLLPTIILFVFSINFITSSLEYWFKAPVEQALEKSLDVGRHLYGYIESHHRFYLERIAYQIKTRGLLLQNKNEELDHYIRVVQKAFHIDAVEIYDVNSKRISAASATDLEDKFIKAISVKSLYGESDAPVRSIYEHIQKGELTRTIGAIPYSAKNENIRGFIVLTALIPADLANNMVAISRGFEEYQQIKLLKEPIRVTYYITISIVALLVLFCAVWVGFYLAKTISIPIRQLAEGTRRVAEGDLGFSISFTADDEIGSLIESFNRMTRDLRISREQLELSTKILRHQNAEIEEKRQYMEIVLQNVSTGVITLDANGYVTTTNISAEKMLDIRAEDIVNKNFMKLLDGGQLDLAKEVMGNLIDSGRNAVEFPLRMTIAGSPRSFIMRVNALKDDYGKYIGIVMVFDDLTDQEKAQRMAAWREVARRIAHEVKNPLTPISLSAQRLSRKYSAILKEPVFDECVRMIIDHVELIRNLVNEFSTFARFPTANPAPCDLPSIIEETVALYREGHENIRFVVDIPNDMKPLNLDRQQIKQAMINLVDNAVGAIKTAGEIRIGLSYQADMKNVRIEIADNGEGISDDDKTRLFEPYFSTKKSGMGLGLAIVNSIVADHNGKISVKDHHPQGAVFIIELPV